LSMNVIDTTRGHVSYNVNVVLLLGLCAVFVLHQEND